MKLKAIHNKFHQELGDIYPNEEIDSFFYILTETYYGIQRIQLAINPDYDLKDSNKITAALKKLKQEIPLQYVIGETEFYGMRFKVNESVLIPRPETEELVGWVLKKTDASVETNILDMGTGSGCIAIALAKHLPKAQVYALEISKGALKVARHNAELNDVNVHFIEADILALQNTFADQKFDVVVSNPPYVRELEKELMKPNVIDNEPHMALFVKDEDPLLFYKAITDFATKRLKPNGRLFFEINEFLGKAMIDLLRHKAFINLELKQDIFKKDRMIKAEKANG